MRDDYLARYRTLIKEKSFSVLHTCALNEGSFRVTKCNEYFHALGGVAWDSVIVHSNISTGTQDLILVPAWV
jgi:hypothetical protein